MTHFLVLLFLYSPPLNLWVLVRIFTLFIFAARFLEIATVFILSPKSLLKMLMETCAICVPSEGIRLKRIKLVQLVSLGTRCGSTVFSDIEFKDLEVKLNES